MKLTLTPLALVFTVALAATAHAGAFGWLFGSGKSTPSSQAHAPVKAAPVEVKTAANVDERLFLLRALSNLNDTWPDENLSADQLQAALAGLRQQATAFRDHLRDDKLDEQLTDAYNRFLGLLDTDTNYLADMGRIDRSATERNDKEAFDSGFNAGSTGAAAGYALSDQGYSTSRSVAAAGVVALGTYLWDDYQKGKERDAAKRQAVEAAQGTIKAAVGEYLTLCKNTAEALSRKYAWKRGEAGFDEPSDYESTRATLIQQGNSDGLAKLTEGLQAKRPRDPFLVHEKASLRDMNNQGDIGLQVASAKECLAATSLVPAGKLYDPYRAGLLCEAALVLDHVSSREAAKTGWGQAFNANAALAVQAWDADLRYDQDFSGAIRQRKVWCLYKSGDLAGALKATESVATLRQNDPEFAYGMACLLSGTGDADNSLAWLKQAVVTLAYSGVQGIKTDPDLVTLRAKKAHEVAELTTLRCRWKIDYGMFNDDLIVTNDAPFALTHVTVGGAITPNNKAWENMLTVDAIAPGTSHTWSSVFSVPGSKIDESRSSVIVKCDQGESRPTLAP